MKKIILITGAGSGIGKAAAFALAKRGHRVLATTHTEEQAHSLEKEALGLNIPLETWKLDITLKEDREKICAYDLDVLINNAGIGETGSLAEVPMERVRNNFEVNVFSSIEMAQVALKTMMEKKKGTILFVSSLAGRAPATFLNPYSMTKFALSGGVAALRKEIHRVAPDVHVSLIEPGAYATGFNQEMMAKKYEWMGADSYFYKIIPELQKEEAKNFAMIEEKSTKSIVAKIVKAAEAQKPRLRYVAPWYQGLSSIFFACSEHRDLTDPVLILDTKFMKKSKKSKNYWLIKSEADCYSIDDLKRDKTIAWEGVRNFQARNFMRDEMQVGDLALFHHSNGTKEFPTGEYGIAKVVSKAHPDETQFDKNNEYYDSRATRVNPVWYCVDFAFVKKFKTPITLAQIKFDPLLKNMRVAKKGERLSIMPVSEKDFEYVKNLSN